MSRICLVYDCLFPHTVGGAERTYRALVERLAAEGHQVTYVTLRQWEAGEDPGVEGVTVLTAGPRMALYTDSGRRRILPPLVFGIGVLWHLLRHGRRYDAVHTASFPYFSLLAAGAVRRRGRYRLMVDWHEVWTRTYWNEYLGRAGGWVGWTVQRACLRIPQEAFCRSALHAERMRDEGFHGDITLVRGAYAGPTAVQPSAAVGTSVVFAGRLIREKRVDVLPGVVDAVRRTVPEVRGDIYGSGPEKATLAAAIAELRIEDHVCLHGFVASEEVQAGIAGALCMLLPSSREGFGLVVVEAASYGTPSVVVAAPDNAAVELIEEGVNGFVASSIDPEDVAAAVLAVHDGGAELRRSTAEWFSENVAGLAVEDSVVKMAEAYGRTGLAVSARS